MSLTIHEYIYMKCYNTTINYNVKCQFRYIWLNTRVFCIILPSDKRGTHHFHQFGELTAEKRFLFGIKVVKDLMVIICCWYS